MPQTLVQWLDTSGFVPRWHCGAWTTSHGFLHIVSDLFIFGAYLTIPLVLVYFVRHRRDVPFPKVFWLFGAFILACGVGHLLEAVIFYWPIYPASGVVKAITATVSWLTVAAMVPIVPRALAMRSPEELEREISRRKRAQARLAEKHRQLQEAERLKSEFFANISHELRTPLTLILAPLESILTENSSDLPAGQRSTLTTVHNNAVRLLQMVAGLLDFSKLDAGKIELKREPLELVQLTRSIVGEFQPMARRKSQALTFDSPCSELSANLDRYLYERILFNLISNALKFTPRDGSIAVRIDQAGERVCLSVADTGIGIAETDLKNLFQRFRQLEGSASRRFEGTGLGLAMVKEFAELMDGSVSVTSHPGEGSTFRVSFDALEFGTGIHESTPRSESQSAALIYAKFDSDDPNEQAADRCTDIWVDGQSAHWAEENRIDGSSGSQQPEGLPEVVIAEDSPELAGYIASLLRPHCRCSIAGNGREAAELVQRLRPDLVLSDVMMPELDGFTLCRRLKADKDTRQIPVVLLTALSHRGALLKGWEAGADEYLFKRFHPVELVARVKSIVGSVQARRESEELKRRARAELEQRVAERTAELAAANRELQREVVQRKRVEDQLRESDRRLRLIADSLPGLIGYVDKDARFQFNNAAYEKWLRIRRGECTGKHVREVFGDAVYDDVQEHVATALGGQTAEFETRISDCNGNRRYVSGVFVPSRQEDGTVDGFYSLMTDITQRYLSERALQRAYRQLQQKSAEMEQFVYSVSHDLKSPLVTILGFVGILKEHLETGNREQALDSMTRIDRAAHRMSALIEGLLELGRIGRVNNRLETIDMAALCRQVSAEFGHQIDPSKTAIDIVEPIPAAFADRARMAEVFDNLLSNAIKYCNQGQDLSVTIGGVEDGHQVRFFVRDNGPGIPPEYHEKIFGLFQRLDTHHEGTGLGLAIVAKIMESHGGRAWVESAAGEGATFWIALPKRPDFADSSIATAR
jgi:PAS domain S-box-containing protein